jgi:hypothetical protein
MCASFSVCDHAVLALKPFCAFDAVELAQTRKIFSGFAALMLLEMLGRFEIGCDLVKVP